MFPKALLVKEWKHSSLIILGILVVFLLQFPIRIGLKLEEWKEIKNQPFFEENFGIEMYEAFSGGIFIVFLIALIFILAAVLIGLEKNSKRHDFSLALPFSRQTMYVTKWFLGGISIALSFVVTYWIGYFMIWQSEFSYLLVEHNITDTFIAPLLGYIVIFSFAMFIGSFTGDMKSQQILSIIFLFFLQGFSLLIQQFFETHQLGYIPFHEVIYTDLFWPSYLIGRGVEVGSLLYPIIGGIIFFLVGLKLFENAPAENNGKFLVFPFLQPLFNVGIPVCAALIGGLIMTMFIPYGLSPSTKILAYWLGAFISVGFVWIISRRIVR